MGWSARYADWGLDRRLAGLSRSDDDLVCSADERADDTGDERTMGRAVLVAADEGHLLDGLLDDALLHAVEIGEWEH